MAARVNTENFAAEVLQAEKPVLVDFYSDSCVPCKRLAPVLADIEEANAETLRVVKVNINFDPDLVEQYDVQSSPTLVLFREGKEAGRLHGAVKKAQILELVNQI